MTDKSAPEGGPKGHKPVRTGPEPERVKGDGDWQQAVKRALRKKNPPEGWPRGVDEVDEKDVMDDDT